MHICIPDTREVRPQHGAAYLLYNVHIDGLYHCSLRFKQLLHLHQSLSKKFGSSSSFNGLSHHPLPSFPPKRLLPLSASKVEERRQQLEKYLQNISQDKTIANSSIFNMFLLEAQRESTKLVEPEKHVHLDIELVNGQKIRLPIVTHDSVDSVLTACCRALGLADRYHAYFCLCLCGYDVVRDKLIIKRKLSFFEAPFITLQMAVQQQEQLQSVLSATVNNNNNNNNNYPNQNQQLTSLSLSSASSSNGNNLNNNSNPCRCQSCSARQQHTTQTTTGVPLVSSSSSGSNSTSYVVQEQQQMSTNSNHDHLQQQQQCNGNSSQSWQQAMTNSSSSSPFVTHRILLRKSYWDPIYDSYILNDQQALNLLFIQTVYDMKHSLMFVDRETYQQLESLLANDSKLEYILLARRLKYYNYVHFEPCYSDYPKPRTKVMISIGSKELNMRVLKAPAAETNGNGLNGNHQRQQQEPVLYCTSSLVPNGYRHLITKDDLIEEEYNFKVPLIRCWRLTSLETLNSNGNQQQQREQHRSTATTTLAGGKRKSLSLFNSVVGNSIPSSPPQASTAESTPQLQGFGGTSLMATLMATNNNQHNQQTSSRRTSTTSISFFNFRGNSNQQSQSQSNGCDAQTTYCQNENQTQPHKQSHLNAGANVCDQTQLSQYELSFEYLIAKDTLKWITISSDQAIFISISLQGVVDELVSKRELGACMSDVGRVDLSTNGTNSQQQLQVSRPISIQQHRQSGNNDRQPTPESFTYMYQDGGQKLIRAKSQQPLESFSLGHSPPSSSTNYSLALAVRHHRMAAASSSNGNYMATPQSRSSTLLQAASLWGNGSHDTSASSPPGRYYGHQSSSGFNNNNYYHSPQTVGSSFEISQFYKKAPSPIINDAFEGVVTNDDDL